MAVFTTLAQGRSIEAAVTIALSPSANLTLEVDQIIPRRLKLTAALTANVIVYFPTVSGEAGAWWEIENATSGSFTVTVQSSAGGSGIAVAQGKRALILWDGTNMVSLVSDVVALGAAAAGANADITALTGITAGITAQGGMNLAGVLGGNQAATSPLRLYQQTIDYASDANKTPTAAQYVSPILVLTSSVSLTATRDLIVPLSSGSFWVVYNNTTGGQSIRVIGSSGTGITIKNGRVGIVRADGTNVVSAHNDVPDLTIGEGTALTKFAVYTTTFDPASLSANSTREETLTVTGITSSDKVFVSKPTHTANYIVGSARPGTDQVFVTVANPSGSAADPGSESWTVVAFRS